MGGHRASPGERDPGLGVGFSRGGDRPPFSLIRDYVGQHRIRLGVEAICTTLTEADVKFCPSTCCAAKAGAPLAWAVRDEDLKPKIGNLHKDSYAVYAGQEGPRAAQR